MVIALRVRRSVEPIDVVIAIALTAATQVEIWAPQLAPAMDDVTGSRLFLAVSSFVMTVPLAVRRRLPVVTCVLVLGAGALQQQLSTPTEGLSTLAAMLIAAYSVSTHGDRRQANLGGAVVLVASLFIGRDAADHLFVLVVLGAAWAMGLAVGRGHRRARALEREKELAAERGAAEERLRIARDLHDIVAHRVSMMVVQAQTADTLATSNPDEARQAMREVDAAGRQALEELRALLGVLHGDVPRDTRTPQPGLDQIDDLVAASRSAGLEVRLARSGPKRLVTPAVGMAAYRVVQEALTNVVKHARGASTEVEVRFAEETLEITVTDDGPGDTGASTPGFGLAGMRERVLVAGGELSAGSTPGRGFRVHVVLPAAPEAP